MLLQHYFTAQLLLNPGDLCADRFAVRIERPQDRTAKRRQVRAPAVVGSRLNVRRTLDLAIAEREQAAKIIRPDERYCAVWANED